MPNDKKISKWKESLVRAGKRKSLFLWILISIFSGFGYFFINPFHDIQYFNKKQTFEPNFISTFYKGNNGFYIMESGKEAEAEKHGIIASKQRIKDFIQKMPEFQKNGSFSGEEMSKFLKDNKVNQYDVWRYAAQQVKNNLFFGAMEDFPSSHTKSINQSIVSQMNLQKISGMQFYLNDDFLKEKMKNEVDKLVNDKKALQKFLSDQFIQSNFRVMTPEKRSGFLIQFPGNFKIERDILNKILVLHDRKKIERFLMKNKIDYEIISLNSVKRDGSMNNILFDSSNIVERGGSQFIPVVSEIIPIDFIALEKENMAVFQEEYRLMLFKKFAFLIAIDIAEKYNNGQISEEELRKISRVKPFEKNLSLANVSQLTLLTLKEKKAIAISNYEEKATIIVCSQRFFNPDNSNSFQIYEKLGINITNKFFEIFFSGLLSFWKDKFEE